MWLAFGEVQYLTSVRHWIDSCLPLMSGFLWLNLQCLFSIPISTFSRLVFMLFEDMVKSVLGVSHQGLNGCHVHAPTRAVSGFLRVHEQ